MFIRHVKICLNYINVYFLNADGNPESILFLYITNNINAIVIILYEYNFLTVIGN